MFFAGKHDVTDINASNFSSFSHIFTIVGCHMTANDGKMAEMKWAVSIYTVFQTKRKPPNF